jgi:Zn-dependent protease
MLSNGGFPTPKATSGRHNEKLELLKAWVGTTLAFTLAEWSRKPLISLIEIFLIMAVAAGLGIVLHELAHRAVARHFGSEAYFLANDTMLVVSVLVALSGFLFAAPGAVWHSGYLNKRQVGLIAAAGPATNMVLAVLFLILIPVFSAVHVQMLFFMAYYGYVINALLGLFNMIPYGPIDGAKIMDWDMRVFVAMASVGGLLFILNFMPFARALFVFGF